LVFVSRSRGGPHDLLVGAGDDTTLIVHVGDGAGGFTPGASVRCPTLPYEIEIGDVTGDGRLDAVIAADELAVSLFDVPGAGGGGPPRRGRGVDAPHAGRADHDDEGGHPALIPGRGRERQRGGPSPVRPVRWPVPGDVRA